MNLDAVLTAGVVVAIVVALVAEIATPAVIVGAALVTLLVVDVIEPSQAFAGFSNPAPITVAALYPLAAAAEKTNLLQPVVSRLLGRSSERRALGRLLGPVAGASAFLNNTPVVAMLVPQISAWAERNRFSPSRFLMPLSFATILGGVTTLIGTSTNLVVSGLLDARGDGALGVFEITPVGLPIAVIGLAVLVVAAPRLLPERTSALRQVTESARNFVVSMEVVPGGPMDGRTVEDAGLRHLEGVFLVEVVRDGTVIAPVSPSTVLEGGDRLTFVGRADLVVDLHRMGGLRSSEHEHLLAVDSGRHAFYEAVIGPASPLVGRTLREVDFRARYQAAVIAIHRAGGRVHAKLGAVRLRAGDTLILLAGPDFRARYREGRDFLLVARLDGAPPTATRHAPLVAAVGAAMIAAAATGLLDIVEAALVAAVVLVATGVLTPGEARDAVDLDVILLIGAAFGVGAAIESSGLATDAADLLVGLTSPLGAAGAVLGVIIATIVLTELVTNNAAAVIVFPIALGVAESAGVDPRRMAIAVAVAASASFLTPIGYQTNTMVYGPGGYRFTDYLRLGAPLTAVLVACLVPLTLAG